MTCIYTERAEAERGIVRFDRLIANARTEGSALAPFLLVYIEKRRAYAATAARHAARIAREERSYDH